MSTKSGPVGTKRGRLEVCSFPCPWFKRKAVDGILHLMGNWLGSLDSGAEYRVEAACD